MTLRNVPAFVDALDARGRRARARRRAPTTWPSAATSTRCVDGRRGRARGRARPTPRRFDRRAGAEIMAAIDAVARPVHPEDDRGSRAAATSSSTSPGATAPTRARRPRSTPAGSTAPRAGPGPARGWRCCTRAASSRSASRSSTSRSSARASPGGSSRRPTVAGARRSCPEITGRAWITGMAPVLPRPGRPVPGRLRAVSTAPQDFDAIVVGAGIVGVVHGVGADAARRAGAAARRRRGLRRDDRARRGQRALRRQGRGARARPRACSRWRSTTSIEGWLGAEARIRRKGALIVHPDARTWAAEPARAMRLRAAGVACELLDADEVRARSRSCAARSTARCTSPATCSATRGAITRALARRAAADGADVREHAAWRRSDVAGGAVCGVLLDGGEALAAPAVVVAAGPWSRPLVEDAGLAFPLEPRKGQLVQLALRDARRAVPAPQGRRRLLPALGRQRGDARASSRRWWRRPSTGRSCSAPRASARVRPLGRRRRGRGDDRPRRRAWSPRWPRWRSSRPGSGFRPWLPDHLPAIGPSRAAAGPVAGHRPRGRGRRARPDHRARAVRGDHRRGASDGPRRVRSGPLRGGRAPLTSRAVGAPPPVAALDADAAAGARPAPPA